MYYDGIHINGYYFVYSDKKSQEKTQYWIILSKEENPKFTNDSFYKARYSEPLSGTHVFERASWCQDNCNSDWLIGALESAFCDEEDLIGYKMRWL